MTPDDLFYSHFGGCLFSDSPVYVYRQADTDLYEALLNRHYCYIINARQMGKSSLRVRTSSRLQEQGVVCAEIDLTGISDQNLSLEQWYRAFIQELAGSLGLKPQYRQWITENPHLSPPYALSHFIENVVFAGIDKPIVIFIDEIDCILNLKSSSDDFLESIRYWHGQRATKPRYRDLTVAIIGSSAPIELLQRSNSAPFNFGQSITLTGFKLEESLVLAEGLKEVAARPKLILQEILDWTCGQPFLTQKLCWLVAQHSSYIHPGTESQKVKEIVHSHILENWELQDDPAHLRTIRDRIAKNYRLRKELLLLYKEILKRGQVKNVFSRASLELQLSGIVTQKRNNLVVTNRIYQEIFDLEWVRSQLGYPKQKDNKSKLLSTLSTNLATALAVIYVRWLGGFEAIELRAYDHILQQMPIESADERLYMVEIDQRDLNKFGDPIPDPVLSELMDTLVENGAQVIGLDLFRDFSRPLVGEEKSIDHHYQNTENLIIVCKKGSSGTDAISPPPLLSLREDQWARVGFANLYVDDSYFIQGKFQEPIRRYVLSMTPNNGDDLPTSNLSTCITPYSFGLQIVIRYLYSQGIQTTVMDDNWVFGHVVTERLQSNSGGYRNLDHRGNQLLLRYRRFPDPQEITPYRTSLRELLLGKNTDWIKDRIVLIGVVSSDSDIHTTPLGELHGVHIHAHLVSQLLSAVYDQRRLPWWLPWWGEGFWILGWSGLAGVISCFLSRSWQRGLGSLGVSIVIYGCCWFAMTQGGWLPLVPPTASIATFVILTIGWQIANTRSAADLE